MPKTDIYNNTIGLCKYYASIVRSLLTYACPAWFPSATQYDIDSLEHIQKRCLKTIYPNLEHYTDRLAASGLPTLEQYMSDLSSAYSSKVIADPNHRLADLVPLRQSTVRRHSSRLPDVLIKRFKTESLYNTVFYKYGV